MSQLFCERCDTFAVVMNNKIYVISEKICYVTEKKTNNYVKVDIFDSVLSCWSHSPDLRDDITSVETVTKRGDKIIVLCQTKGDHCHQAELQEFMLMDWERGKRMFLENMSIIKAATNTAFFNKSAYMGSIIIEAAPWAEFLGKSMYVDYESECWCECVRCDEKGKHLLTIDIDDSDAPSNDGSDAPSDDDSDALSDDDNEAHKLIAMISQRLINKTEKISRLVI